MAAPLQDVPSSPSAASSHLGTATPPTGPMLAAGAKQLRPVAGSTHPGSCFKEGLLSKFSIGKGALSRKNWKERWFVVDDTGLRYFGKKPMKAKEYSVDKQKGCVAWRDVVRVLGSVRESEHPHAINSDAHFYFGVEFVEGVGKKRSSYTLLLDAEGEAERHEWINCIIQTHGLVTNLSTQGSNLFYEMADEEELHEEDLGQIDDLVDLLEAGAASDLDSSDRPPSLGHAVYTPANRTIASSVSSNGTYSVGRSGSPMSTSLVNAAPPSYDSPLFSRGGMHRAVSKDAIDEMHAGRRRKGSKNPGTALSIIKRLVSKNKKRFVRDSFDLDLVYITPQFIAMGFPSEGHEAYYRNKLEDVERFFDLYHPGHFRIYNLCKERGYSKQALGGAWERHPFEDHNPPPLSAMPRILQSLHAYLTQDPQNVAAVHCKAGKGRTGTIITSYLATYHNMEPEKALSLFGIERTTDGKGVTIPSQIRYVSYCHRLMTELQGKVFAPSLKLLTVTLHNVRHAKVALSDMCSELYFIVTKRHDNTQSYEPTYGEGVASCCGSPCSPAHSANNPSSSAPSPATSPSSAPFRSIGAARRPGPPGTQAADARKRGAGPRVGPSGSGSTPSSCQGSLGATSPVFYGLDADERRVGMAADALPLSTGQAAAGSIAHSSSFNECMVDFDTAAVADTDNDECGLTFIQDDARTDRSRGYSGRGTPSGPSRAGGVPVDPKEKFETVYDSRNEGSQRVIRSHSNASFAASPDGSIDNSSFNVSSFCGSTASPCADRKEMMNTVLSGSNNNGRDGLESDQAAVEFSVSNSELLYGDVRISFYVESRVPFKPDQKLFHFWLNTAFMPESGALALPKLELDGLHKDKSNHIFAEDFGVSLSYVSASESIDLCSVNIPVGGRNRGKSSADSPVFHPLSQSPGGGFMTS
eukprot:Rhum_TRINITY_DN15604_c0_g1::Rhum_TRINITY_DN15604_c0_g1_i1::g.161641::m.161641/K01110/PTEN; phosphatidylinositol-3,4,5-trisphosphate 3-phosphatase and dual-specificity protein phosphatase PTEN